MKKMTRGRAFPRPDDLAQLTTFRWPVRSYGLVKGKDVRLVGSQLSTAERDRKVFLIEYSSPPEPKIDAPDAALFREFADTPMTPNGMLGFATKHGWLGVGDLVLNQAVVADLNLKNVIRMADLAKLPSARRVTRRRKSPMKGLHPCSSAEQLETWCKEIATMDRLVCLWDLTTGSNAQSKRFDQRIRWIGG